MAIRLFPVYKAEFLLCGQKQLRQKFTGKFSMPDWDGNNRTGDSGKIIEKACCQRKFILLNFSHILGKICEKSVKMGICRIDWLDFLNTCDKIKRIRQAILTELFKKDIILQKSCCKKTKIYRDCYSNQLWNCKISESVCAILKRSLRRWREASRQEAGGFRCIFRRR